MEHRRDGSGKPSLFGVYWTRADAERDYGTEDETFRPVFIECTVLSIAPEALR